MAPAAGFPPEVERLFWDVDPAGIDLARHADYVLERVMARGGWVAMQWLRRTYPAERARRLSAAEGWRARSARARVLGPRERRRRSARAGRRAPAVGGTVKGITAAQVSALAKIATLVPPSAYLAGGVAIAVRLGHRQSLDLDLFVPKGDPATSIDESTGGVTVLTRQPGTLYLEVDGVPASVLRYTYPLLAPVEPVEGLAIPLASHEDLVCMKLSAIASRGKARDFWDLHALLTDRRGSLREALDAYTRKYAQDDIGHVVRSLAYFADAEAEPLPRGLTPAHWMRVRDEVAAWVRALP
jgi:hypothetical protein